MMMRLFEVDEYMGRGKERSEAKSCSIGPSTHCERAVLAGSGSLGRRHPEAMRIVDDSKAALGMID